MLSVIEALGSLISVGFYSVSDVRLTCGQSSSSCCVGTQGFKKDIDSLRCKKKI